MDLSLPKLEKKTLKYWKQNRIFEKSIKQRKNSPNFVFYEGPPTANGRPGIHHVESRVFKDIICRYRTMAGSKVLRKAGWDTHGLPVELEIEKKLGLKNKKDIEKYGIAKFNQKCRESVWQYQSEWEKLTERIGYWLDMDDPYITYQPKYMETLWWIIKQLRLKNLLYQGHKVVPYCPRCGTSLSSHEVALGYKSVKDPSVYVKLEIKPNVYLLVWTTTPWTLPANVAVAVNPEFVYAKVRVGNEYLILAKERIKPLGIEGEVIEEIKGKDLLGTGYEPLYKFTKPDKKAWFVIPADFVSLEEGTGLVHIAPAFGEDDMEAGKKNGLPVILNVDKEGKFQEEVKGWAGVWVKDADPAIIQDLSKRGLLFKEELYEHDYPFCWRCGSPLIYYAKESWFINVQKTKRDLIKNNRGINWVPSHLKEGRFGGWLKELKDWAFSRERYWGTPLPVWQCSKCKDTETVGSLKELSSLGKVNNNYFVLRHGDSCRQKSGKAVCWPEKIRCPLTKEGEKQVGKSAKELKKKKIDIIYSSDLLRTRQTAEIAAKELGAKIIFDKRLREYNVGIFNGEDPKKSWDYLKSRPGDMIFTKLPKGERLVDIGLRTHGFLKAMEKKYKGKNVLVVSHELTTSMMEGMARGESVGEVLEWRMRKPAKKIGTGKWRKLKYSNLPRNKKMEIDLHRPFIDEIKLECSKCGGSMERVPDLIDVWFDSGSMPFSQYHYPFENKDLIDKKKQFPADYISEAVDQTRGWFYTLLAVSTLLGFGPPYKNVISLGHVLDEKGEKMSKSKGNIVSPWEVIEKYGADAVRWYFFTVNQPGDAKLFTERDIDQALKKFIMTYWNSFVFYQTYSGSSRVKGIAGSKNILDKWIISKLNKLTEEVTEKLQSYDVIASARAIEEFVINDFSQWHIRRSRRRLQRPQNKTELNEAAQTMGFVLLSLSKITAPFVPFISEEIYRNVGGGKASCHLEDWPKADKKLINEELNKKMEKVRETVNLALSARAEAKIKVRQPLRELVIPEKIPDKELIDLIKEEVNIKEVGFGKELKLDTKITAELEEEGIIREVSRLIQRMRKMAGYKPRHKIKVQYSGDEGINDILSRNKEKILEEIKAEEFILRPKLKDVFDVEEELKVGNYKLWAGIKKI